MSKHRVYQILLVSGAGLLFILIMIAPRNRVDDRFVGYSADEAAVTLALTYMNDAKGPMKGIKMLDKIAEVNPSNALAISQLAEFSMQTGQFAKAAARYEALAKITSGNEKVNALIGLSNAAQSMGDTTKTIMALEELFDISNDSLLLQSAKQRINLLRKP